MIKNQRHTGQSGLWAAEQRRIQLPLIYNEAVKGFHLWFHQRATWCLSWVTSVLLCPDVSEERPLRVADPHSSRWEVGSPSPRATTQQSTLVSRAVPPNLGAEGYGHFSITLRIWLALDGMGCSCPHCGPTFPLDHRWGRKGQLCWHVSTSCSLLGVYADTTQATQIFLDS